MAWLVWMSPALGASSLVIHSNKHSSCAVREHGQGERHSWPGTSSVESCWQIQQVRISIVEGEERGIGGASCADESADPDSCSILSGKDCDDVDCTDSVADPSRGSELARCEEDRLHEA